MSIYKKIILKLIPVLGALATGLFLLLNLTGADEVNVVPMELNDVGYLRVKMGNTPPVELHAFPNSLISAFFTPKTETPLTVVWANKNAAGEDSIMFSTLTGKDGDYDNWFGYKLVFAQDYQQLNSTYGVQTIILDDVNQGMLCLFIKDSEGQIKYTCKEDEILTDKTYRYDDLQAWFPSPVNFDLKDWKLNDVSGMISVTPSTLSTTKFYAAASNYLYDGYAWYWTSKDIQCNVTGTNLNDECEIKTSPIALKGPDPSIIILKDKNNQANEIRVFFFRGANDEVFYRIVTGDFNESPNVQLKNTSNSTAVTKKPMTAYHFKDHIYMTWSDENNRVYFSKLPVDKLNSPPYYGYGLWELFLQDVDIRSSGPPNIFEYNNKLYILYADASKGNRISYYRIDCNPQVEGDCLAVMD